MGQERAVELLEQAIARDRIAPAYLFAGPSGTGRSLAAKGFCARVLSLHLSPPRQATAQKRVWSDNHPDLLWVAPTYLHQGRLLRVEEAEAAGLKRKAPPQIRIEQVRDIAQFLSRPSLEASRSAVVIEEAQTMAEAAANALLKTLEEPGRATLILIAPSADVLLPTLVSRCQRVPFSRLSQAEMERVLRSLGREEILGHDNLLAIAQGSPGEAIAAFTRWQALPEAVRQPLEELPNSSLKALELAKTIERELDVETQLWLVDYLQHTYWQKWQQTPLVEALEKARRCLGQYVQPRLVWECTLLELGQLLSSAC